MCSGQVAFNTGESGFDTVLSVHSDCPEGGDSHALFCDDDSGPGLTSSLVFEALAGTRYLVRIAGFGGSGGDFDVQVWYPDVANDLCSSPVSVAPNTTYAFQNCSAGTDGPTAAGGTSFCTDHLSHDLWYLFFPHASGTLTLDTCGSNFDTMLQVFGGAACPGAGNTGLACNDDAPAESPCANQHGTSYIRMGVVGFIPYLIRVGGFDQTSPTGNGLLHIGFAPTCRCDWNLSGQLSVQDLFDFLASYFSGTGDFNASGATTVQDIFDYLACYFGGC
jgi:hypothetical protein